jgi:hypothetical protein
MPNRCRIPHNYPEGYCCVLNDGHKPPCRMGIRPWPNGAGKVRSPVSGPKVKAWLETGHETQPARRAEPSGD